MQQQDRDERQAQVADRTGGSHKRWPPFWIAQVVGVEWHRLAPSKPDQQNGDEPHRVNMRDGVEREAPHAPRRVVTQPGADQRMRKFMDRERDEKRNDPQDKYQGLCKKRIEHGSMV